MSSPSKRLYFIDAIRAFAILMMLQGHFVHALLGDAYRDRSNFFYSTWEYFRGMTAPTFFTITGFVFVFLLLKTENIGWKNPRVKKGIKRAGKLLLWGYLLRLNFLLLFSGELNAGFLLTDVLQIIGISILLLIGLYVLFYRKNGYLFKTSLLVGTLLIFTLEPWYSSKTLEFLPGFLANFFTQAEGSVFYIFPWFGYVTFGALMAALFLQWKDRPNFYANMVYGLLCTGLLLIYFSSWCMLGLYELTGIEIFKGVAYNNYLYIRLGNVLILFAVFTMLRNYLTNSTMVKIGSKTLSIYIIHFIILYGSWTGLGLNRWFAYSLTPMQAVFGAIFFMAIVSVIVLTYYRHESWLIEKKNAFIVILKERLLSRFAVSRSRNR